MANDQQFCLRWNNHQSTLTSIFDWLLENESLLDCTLAAEGQYVQAHRILLSACSPYFQTLLSRHVKKEPIIILKDVTFKELKALMDYMYKGEVNVSQDELGALLKVAENLQIKGLSDSGGNATQAEEPRPQQRPPPPPVQQPPSVPRNNGLTVEHRRSNYQTNSDNRTESPSTLDESSLPRKRKRTRRRSSDDESGLGQSQPSATEVDDSPPISNSSLIIQPVTSHRQSLPKTSVIPETTATLNRSDLILPEPSAHPLELIPKTEPGLLQPKQETDDQAADNNIEDLTMDDDDDDFMDDSQPGPSHGSEDSSNQDYAQWQMGTDGLVGEDLLRAQEAAGGSRDSQEIAHALLKSGYNEPKKRGHPSAESPAPAPRRVVAVRPIDDMKFDNIAHWPGYKKGKQRCKVCIKAYSRTKCEKCNVALCLNKDRNCFKIFHTRVR